MEHLLTNESSKNPDVTKRVSDSKGFCNRHTHMLYKTSSGGGTEDGLGYAYYMQIAVRKIKEEIMALPARITKDSTSKGIASRLTRQRQSMNLIAKKAREALPGKRLCPACQFLWSYDKNEIITLLGMLDDAEFRKKFESSKGLCLPHFVAALNAVNESHIKNPSEVSRSLVHTELNLLQEAEKLLSEFIRKHDWKFSGEPYGSEARANFLALNLLVGAEGLYYNSHRIFDIPESK